MKLIKLRSKDTTKKLPKVIPPEKGKQKPYKREKIDKFLDKHSEY